MRSGLRGESEQQYEQQGLIAHTFLPRENRAEYREVRREYYDLRLEVHNFCRNLIYPVPDPSFPFLGVHFTRMIDGGVECGPNAVLAFAREGYRKTDVNFRDLAESLTYSGFLRLAWKHWRMGAGEMWRSLSKRAFVTALQRLIPEIREKHLVPGRAGVRAQALSRDGSLVDDFLIEVEGPIVNVLNAPRRGYQLAQYWPDHRRPAGGSRSAFVAELESFQRIPVEEWRFRAKMRLRR